MGIRTKVGKRELCSLFPSLFKVPLRNNTIIEVIFNEIKL
jgi:hypothetical protein